jgi:hypothetical protein
MKHEIYGRDPALLSCWKDIAKYLGKGVRTVQRWERDFDLPVRRPKGTDHKSAVAAHPRDLEAWLASRWALRATPKETAEPHEVRAAFSELQQQIQDQIEAARALRAQHGTLIQELSTAMQTLTVNCRRLSATDTPVRLHPRTITDAHFSGASSLPPWLDGQRRSNGEKRSAATAPHSGMDS